MFVLIQWCCQPGGQRLKQYRHKKLRSLTQVSNFHDTLVLYLLMYENSRSLSTYFWLISLERKFDFAISYFSGLMGQGHTQERVLKQGESGLRCKMQFLYIGAQGPIIHVLLGWHSSGKTKTKFLHLICALLEDFFQGLALLRHMYINTHKKSIKYKSSPLRELD